MEDTMLVRIAGTTGQDLKTLTYGSDRPNILYCQGWLDGLPEQARRLGMTCSHCLVERQYPEQGLAILTNGRTWMLNSGVLTTSQGSGCGQFAMVRIAHTGLLLVNLEAQHGAGGFDGVLDLVAQTRAQQSCAAVVLCSAAQEKREWNPLMGGLWRLRYRPLTHAARDAELQLWVLLDQDHRRFGVQMDVVAEAGQPEDCAVALDVRREQRAGKLARYRPLSLSERLGPPRRRALWG
jgi:hypothetical protein